MTTFAIFADFTGMYQGAFEAKDGQSAMEAFVDEIGTDDTGTSGLSAFYVTADELAQIEAWTEAGSVDEAPEFLYESARRVRG